jgi:hypothetical protein
MVHNIYKRWKNKKNTTKDIESTSRGYENNEVGEDVSNSTPPWEDTFNRKVLLSFVHIPKAGGTSLNGYLAQIYGRYMVKYHSYFNPTLFEETTEITAKEILCISSHRGYGIHRLFGSKNPNKPLDNGDGLFAGRDIRYITIIRNPLDRMISYYNFVTTFPAHHHYDEVNEMDIYAFYEYLESKNDPEYSNLQCYLITGRASRSFEQARDLIDSKFFAAAPVERSTEFIQYLSLRMGWPKSVPYEVRNISPKKMTSDKIDDNLKKFLLKHNNEDYKLYNYIVNKFDEDLAVLQNA